MDNIRISIIVPVYNAEKYLAECLDSLVGQTMQEGLEIIVVNDGSTDGSADILAAYADRYPDLIRVFSMENHGVSYARNYGAQHSSGEYILFADSDDRLYLDACEKLYRKASRDGNDLVLFGFDQYDCTTGKISVKLPLFASDNFCLADTPNRLAMASPYPWNKLIRRDLFLECLFPVGIRYEDVPPALFQNASASCIGVLWEPLYFYRYNLGFSSAISKGMLDTTRSLAYTRRIFKKKGLYDRYRDALEYWAVNRTCVRGWQLLPDEQHGRLFLKLRIITRCFWFLRTRYPAWRKNPLIPQYLPKFLHKYWYFYSSWLHMCEAMIRCEYKTPEEYRRFLKIRLQQHPFRGFD
ncbi:MAG: glycosyltransferase family 2 protein [Blautia sp.]|nr:glycosyltransferase family 2 protein [Blautia sp.]